MPLTRYREIMAAAPDGSSRNGVRGRSPAPAAGYLVVAGP